MLKRTILMLVVLFISSCTSTKVIKNDEITSPEDQKYKHLGKLFGDDSLIIGESKKYSNDNEVIKVNKYLWRAALDVISFMPLKIIDPFGGVIVTEWYSPPKITNERIKVNILVLSGKLRVNGIKVSIFRQILDNNQWVEAEVNEQSNHDLEDAMLTRAREIKVKSKI